MFEKLLAFLFPPLPENYGKSDVVRVQITRTTIDGRLVTFTLEGDAASEWGYWQGSRSDSRWNAFVKLLPFWKKEYHDTKKE